jgi:hypothetical protein
MWERKPPGPCRNVPTYCASVAFEGAFPRRFARKEAKGMAAWALQEGVSCAHQSSSLLLSPCFLPRVAARWKGPIAWPSGAPSRPQLRAHLPQAHLPQARLPQAHLPLPRRALRRRRLPRWTARLLTCSRPTTVDAYGRAARGPSRLATAQNASAAKGKPKSNRTPSVGASASRTPFSGSEP